MMIMLLTTNMMFMFMNHPMSMGMILIIQTLLMSIISGMLMKTFWLSYILLITMLSGMLILFIYMSSMASNEKFKNNMTMWTTTSMLLLLTGASLFLMEKMIIKNNYWGMEMNNLKMNETFFLNKMFMYSNCTLTIMMVMYLLLTMIVSSYMVNISEGPLRMKL